MIFYHFTSRGALLPILREGLSLGEAPIGWHRVLQAVNLTTDPDSSGHGLDCGGHVVSEEESAKFAAHGYIVPAGTVYTDKRQVRIKIKLASSDPNLKRWRSWSRKHCEPGFADILERSAGATPQKAKSWWLYFGVIPPSQFEQIVMGEDFAASAAEAAEAALYDITMSSGSDISLTPADC